MALIVDAYETSQCACVRMSVCLCVCVSVCVCAWERERAGAYEGEYVRESVFVCECVFVFVCVCVRMFLCLRVRSLAHTNTMHLFQLLSDSQP